jgi:hypothetical protein
VTVLDAQKGDRVYHPRYNEGTVIAVHRILREVELEIKWDSGTLGRVWATECVARKRRAKWQSKTGQW